jgi:predicted Ser/Thr protein kinase
MSGRTVAGKYELQEMLGKGGFGSVYSGRDASGARSVAVKVFRRSEGLAARAEREARTASKLTHPNIHSVVGVESDDDNAYLISELVVGERFDRSELTDEQAVRAIAAVADALDHAHSRGVIHRDVKPANILVSTDGEVCLTDFGIARDDDALETTLEERLMGTLSYMAPEQAAGERASGATDVWAAALTLYSHLAGRNPFKARTLPDLLEKLREGARPLSETRPDIPRALSNTLAQALDHDPRKRPAAAELRDRLLTALAPEVEPAEPEAAADSPDPTPRVRSLPLVSPLAGRALSSAVVATTTLYVLTAFPFYPTQWTLPLAAVLAVVAWFRPLTALTVGAVMCVPAFWNLAEAAGLLWIGMAAIWLRLARDWGRNRPLAPLLAWPLALIGLGPAFVLVAATAPTQRRRIAEASLGAVIVLAAGGLVPAEATRSVAGANNPLVYLGVLAHAPDAVGVAIAMIVFATILPRAWNEPSGRRAHAVALWGIGFGLSMIAVPLLSGSAGQAWQQAALVACVAAIIPAAWALVHPRVSFGR